MIGVIFDPYSLKKLASIMKNIMVLFGLFLSLIFIQSCHDHESHDHNEELVSNYTIQINSPITGNYAVGDTLFLNIDFDETDSLTVHHVNVQLFNAVDSTLFYSEPQEAHVHATEGGYSLVDEFILDASFANSDLVLIAKVWGHEEGLGEIEEKINIHVTL
mgnify:CR=1 FL=1